MDFPGGWVVNTPADAGGFDPWSGKIPHAPRHLSPRAATAEACVPQSMCAATRETTAMRSPCLQLERGSPRLEKSPQSNKDSGQPNMN